MNMDVGYLPKDPSRTSSQIPSVPRHFRIRVYNPNTRVIENTRQCERSQIIAPQIGEQPAEHQSRGESMSDDSEPRDGEDKGGRSGSGIAIGIAIGVAIGAGIGNVGLGIAIGVALGVAMGAATRRPK